MRKRFDIEIKKGFKNLEIDYGIIEGDNIIVFIKSGLDGSLYGYKNKYLEMADRLNKMYNCTVICSSNPSNVNKQLEESLELISKYAQKFETYKIYYLGFSNGGLIGIWYGALYEKIEKIISVNSPLMYNYHKTKAGIEKFNGKSITLIYGEKDQSIKYIGLLKFIKNKRLNVKILPGEDHYISKNMENFYLIPEIFFVDN